MTAWGIGPIFNKALSVSTSSIVFYRMLFGLPIMVVMAYMNGGSLNKHVIRKAALPGFMFAMSFITGFATVKMTSIANATMVGTLQPVLVLFVAPKLFGEKITTRKLVYSISAMVGVLVVVMAAASTSGAHLDGDLLAVAVEVHPLRAGEVQALERLIDDLQVGLSLLAAVAEGDHVFLTH